MTGYLRAAVLLALVAGAVFAWRAWHPSDERIVCTRLDALTRDVNETASEGVGAVARAADIGSYFTEDVVVELGEGAPPIVGRATLVGMASRLQRRTAAFTLRFDDVHVKIGPDRTTADVSLTASFLSRGDGADGGFDAREFALAMTRGSGMWRIARVAAVDTLLR